MALFEGAAYIESFEFEQAKSKRVQEVDLQPQQLYMAMLRGMRLNHEVAKVPARVEKMSRSGRVVIALISFLDNDLKTKAKSDVSIGMGYFEDFSTRVFVISPDGLREPFRVEEGFLKDYEEGVDSIDQAISRELLAAEDLRRPIIDTPPQRIDALEG